MDCEDSVLNKVRHIIKGGAMPKKLPESVTFSRNVFIPVTNVCRNKCAYCGFRRSIDDAEARLMQPEEVRGILSNAGRPKEALFTTGECPEDVPGFRRRLSGLGYETFVEYITDLCRMAVEYGLLPHTNMGVLSYDELRSLKPYNASMGLMLETTANLEAHNDSPGKYPARRIQTIRDAGRLRIPFTTGLLIGIGETWDDRLESLKVIKELHEKYDHIQEVIIQNFKPKCGTPMQGHNPPAADEMQRCVAAARLMLPDDIAVQVPPNLISNPLDFIRCGATDLGGISEITMDYINPEDKWPDEAELREKIRPVKLVERLPVYKKYINKGWYGKGVDGLIDRYSVELEL